MTTELASAHGADSRPTRYAGHPAAAHCSGDLLSPDAQLELKTFLGRALRLDTRLADGQPFVRCGYVRTAQQLGADGSFARYCDVAAWQWGGEVDAFLADTRPRSYCVQYNEDDLAFISRLLVEEGLGWRVEADDEAPGGHRVTIFADSRSLPEDQLSAASGGIRFHRADSQEEQDSVIAFGQHLRLTGGLTTFLAYDYKAKKTVVGSVPTTQAFAGPHDGTMPKSSGISPLADGGSNIRQQFKLVGFGHEPAYKNDGVQRASLFAINKIAGTAKVPS